MKRFRKVYLYFGCFMLAVLTAYGCGLKKTEPLSNETKQITAPQPPETEKTTGQNVSYPCGILSFPLIENSEKLVQAMENGKLPESCNVLYDAMGSRPDVDVTDESRLQKIYTLLSQIEVIGESNEGITDCYHHVIFTLQDGEVVRFGFEGEDLLSIGMQNYAVTGGSGLWAFIRQLQEDTEAAAAAIDGSYGEISVCVPAGWTAEEAPEGSSMRMSGAYGLILRPEHADDGQIELFCSENFGVCGTGLTMEETTLAGQNVYIGIYDDRTNWDFIIFGEDKPQMVALCTDCSSWKEEMWEEAEKMLDTACFDKK